MPRLLNASQAKLAGSVLAAVRAAIGLGAWLAPSVMLRPWVGEPTSSEAGGKLIARSLGARDLALGAGALLAQRHDGPTRGWIEAGALADAGDLGATLIAFPRLPRRTRWGILGLIAGAVVAGAIIAPCVDAES
jgi:hypothetical protein